ncbi:lactate utilization protein [Marinifilum flexuosum]|uniref:lactate utilization protein n=1 Tax=Marinifilum flexuosum TaxID=1117708 RepID=UPI0024956DF6|nr:lactate utilization protein [Marinifilum flexuosum]
MDLLVKTKEQLERNNFEVFISESSESAYHTFVNEILPTLNAKSVSYGDSKTMHETRVLDYIKTSDSYEFIDTFKPEDTWREQISQRKKALTADLFLTGSNAITEKGCLVNLDMIGNRIAALTFGPRHVVLFVGRNKIVKDLESARRRVKDIAAIKNAQSHKNLNIPCQKTGKCMDCSSPHRICNSWTITEKSYPKNRIKIVLINEDLGY